MGTHPTLYMSLDTQTDICTYVALYILHKSLWAYAMPLLCMQLAECPPIHLPLYIYTSSCAKNG